MKKSLAEEEREKQMAEDIWLNYLNRYLFEHETISEKEYKKMTELISIRSSRRSLKRDPM